MDESQKREPSAQDSPHPESSQRPDAKLACTRAPALPADAAWALLSLQSDAVALVDPEGHMLFVNEAAGRRLGKPTSELVGACFLSLWPQRRQPHVRLVFDQVMRTGTPASFVEGQGDQWSEVLILRISEPDRAAVVAIQIRDVSQRISAEERLKRVVLQLISVQEDERRRIAQDLHDDFGQRMAALLLSLKAAEQAVASGRGGVEAEIRHCVTDAEALTRQMRQVLYYLRPPALTKIPLAEAIEALCSSFARDTGLQVDFSSQEALPPVPDAQAVAIYRLVQEGLHNALKHARATSLWVSLDMAEGELAVAIEDNGQGFIPEHARDGLGLQSIRDRFLLLSGTFEIESAPGEGTRLYGSLPVTPPATAGSDEPGFSKKPGSSLPATEVPS